uniref:Uncharacterized protein n=1 Tax=Lepeophtheirus salmonis TaxID=72036 RepID=A0A0K2UXW2_LEPSM
MRRLALTLIFSISMWIKNYLI